MGPGTNEASQTGEVYCPMLTDDQLKKLRERGTGPAWVNRGDPATEPQRRYIAALIKERVIPETWLLRIKSLEESGDLTKQKASQIIGSLRVLDKKPNLDPRNEGRTLLKVGYKDVPKGYYALPITPVEEGGNDIVYYRVWKKTRDEVWGKIYQIAGPNEHEVRGPAVDTVLKSIVRFGVGDSAVLYGQTVGRCSQCHLRLTKRISRKTAMGDICGGRVYGKEVWAERVQIARDQLEEQGLDPDESVE